jgi:phosphoesterase RecJ-like protein
MNLALIAKQTLNLIKVMNKNDSINDITAAIEKAKTITVVSHYNPDADAYGSSCALYLALKSSGKKVNCANESRFVKRYAFIPGIEDVKNNLEEAELAIVCDCGSLARTGDNFKLLLASYSQILNIDHHISNDYFGHLNYVQEQSSTCEVIYNIIKHLKIKLTPAIATALFAGISGDTGSFRYSSASPATFRIAADLIENGADADLISSAFWGSKSLAAVKLHAEVMRSMKLHSGGKLAEVVATKEMYELTGSTADDTEDLVERARDIEGIYVSILIKWDNDQWKISMRSKDKKYNVSDVAALFGGGGHIAAAAFRWKKSLEELRSAVIPKLEEILT